MIIIVNPVCQVFPPKGIFNISFSLLANVDFSMRSLLHSLVVLFWFVSNYKLSRSQHSPRGALPSTPPAKKTQIKANQNQN